MDPVATGKGFVHGLKTYWAGVGWLRQHPRFLVALFVPMVGGLAALVGAVAGFVAYDDAVLNALLFQPEAWYAWVFYYLLAFFLYIAVLVVTFVAALLVMNILAAPIYEGVSIAVERRLTGDEEPELTIWQNIKAIVSEIKKVALILAISGGMLLIPGLNVLTTLVAAFLVGWDFFDFPLARHGWPLRTRLRIVGENFWTVTGFGLWMLIPFAHIVLLPLAVPGGTMLGLEAMERSREGPVKPVANL